MTDDLRTRIEHCPACDCTIGMWGMGAAGGMECECWDGEKGLDDEQALPS